ncbi:hypothetical protein KR52_11345 [Synechococcus sp. KORDI-52]|nr:hypothetical protein KR52_11345 [Synechococcus sp. KORDI-52]
MFIIESIKHLCKSSTEGTQGFKPYAVLTGCMAISILLADLAINNYVAQKRNNEFKDDIIQLGLSIRNDLIKRDYNQIDEALLGFLRIKRAVNCLTVFNSSNEIQSTALRLQIDETPTIHYGELPQQCQLEPAKIKQDTDRWQIRASTIIENDNIPIGTLVGYTKTNLESITTIRSIEAALLTALSAVFIPAFIQLRLSGKRELRMEKDKAERISSLMNKLEKAEQRTRSAFEGSNDGWWQWNVLENKATLSGKIIQLLEVADDNTISEVNAVISGDWWRDYVSQDDKENFQQFLLAICNKDEKTARTCIKEKELVVITKRSKTEIHLRVTAVITEYEKEIPSSVALVVNNITSQEIQKKRIHHLAFHDQLTGLYNRSALEHGIESGDSENSNYQLVFMALDLDKFKFINDSYGHSVGDELLIQVANRLKSELKQEDFIARIGGDEFVVLMRFDSEGQREIVEKAKSIADRLLTALSKPYDLENCVANNTSSIGISIEKGPKKSGKQLMDEADLALYKAKAKGRNRYFFYQDGMAQGVRKRAKTASLLQSHLERNMASIKLEPLVSLTKTGSPSRDMTITGYEALFRCPSISATVPYLIQCAEEAGIIRMVTDCVLKNISNLTREGSIDNTHYVSVNISPLEFLEANFPHRFLNQLNRNQLNPQRIKIEITESTLLQDLGTTRINMQELNAAGVEFLIDDFGTGYSSIELLRGLPFHYLKIDRSYINNMKHTSGLRLVRAMIELGKAFDLTVIGEGVETQFQLSTLESLGCDHGQGYLFNDKAISGSFMI